jgi:hypothetical protein
MLARILVISCTLSLSLFFSSVHFMNAYAVPIGTGNTPLSSPMTAYQQQQLQKQQPRNSQLAGSSKIFEIESDTPSLEEKQRIQTQTPPGNILRAQIPAGNLMLKSQPPITKSAIPNIATPNLGIQQSISSQPIPDTGALARGCKTSLTGRVDPQWVSVDPSDVPVVVEGIVSLSKVSHDEFPFNHQSHDQNTDVIVDPQYIGLVGSSNDKINSQPRIMEMEWEIGTANTGITDRFPKQFWPMDGDRVLMMGRWAWDCGHFHVDLSNPSPRYAGWQTEIHPPFATAFTRSEPYIFPGDNKPSSAVKSYIYIHGQGGYYNIPVGGRNYEFDIPLPPKPSKLPTTQLRYAIAGLPFGGPQPILTAKPQENKAHVVIPLSSVPASTSLKYGAIVAAKWIDTTRALPSTEGFRTLKVTFDSIKVNNDHDPLASGEWNKLWVGVNGKWIELSGPLGHFGLDDVDDGDVKAFPAGIKSVTLIVPQSGTLKIRTTGWETDPIDDYFGTRGCLCNPFLLDDNDNIGVLNKDYSAVNNFGIGSHADGSALNGDSDTNHDFTLNYHIEQIGVSPPTPPVVSRAPATPVVSR